MTSFVDQVVDRAAILQVVGEWGIWRDTFRWEELRATYAREGRMTVSWFDGTADEFIEGCRRMSLDNERRILNQHLIGTSGIELAGDRAVVETRTTILARLAVDDVPCDVTMVGRFHDRFAREGGWKIAHRVVIFEKDSIAPVDPTVTFVPDAARLARYPEAYRWAGYFLANRGMEVNLDLPTPGSPVLERLYSDGRDWLAGV
jgi:hypothetical protein